ncbi:MAG: sensor histidine kinase [Candidatus Accumulibacter sp.]|nr:sensor histidine kinase [Accumulibacter sp.]
MSLLAVRRSLRLRLFVGTVSWIVVSLLAAGWGLSALFRQHVETQFLAELNRHLDQLTAQLAIDARGRPTLSASLSDPRWQQPYSGLYWQIDAVDEVAAAQPAVLRSRSLWDVVLVAPVDTPADGQIHRHRLAGPNDRPLTTIERQVRLGNDDETATATRPRTFRLLVAAEQNLLAEPLSRFNDALWLALSVLGGGLAIAALVQVIVGLAPLRKLHAALARVRDGDTVTLQGDFPAEVMPLVDEFNHVLAHNAAVVDRARTQAGNLAHALKTPLSVLANAATGQDDDLARQVRRQVTVANNQVQYHLSRAQRAAAVRLAGARTPLTAVVDGLLRTMRRLHAAKTLELVWQPPATDILFRGEEQDLQEMLGNLFDNACKWARSRVEVSARLRQTSLIVDIDDDGPGIASELRDAVLRRGVRADERTPGSGLGLAIVDELAQLHGGELHLADSTLGGLRARLTLPAAVLGASRS